MVLQLSACALHSCLLQAYDGSDKDFWGWDYETAEENLNFRFWWQLQIFQIHYMLFARSITESNFKMFVMSLRKLVKWFFILDNFNYAKWFTVHICDLLTLPRTNPALYDEFNINGNFVIQISKKQFYTLHLGQAHEQANKEVKSIKG